MVNDSCSPIPQVEENKKQYTTRDVKRADNTRQLQNINGQPLKQILYAVDNNIIQNLPILREDTIIAEDIYWPSVPHLQGKTDLHKVQNMEPIIVPNSPKGILDRCKNATIFCDLIHINGIGCDYRIC